MGQAKAIATQSSEYTVVTGPIESVLRERTTQPHGNVLGTQGAGLRTQLSS